MINYGPVTVAGMGTSYTITFAQPIDKADRVTLTIGIPDTDMFMGWLNVLPGDIFDNGKVTNKDLSLIHRELKGASMSVFSDIFGDGTPSQSQYKSARKFIGTKLPKLGGKPPKAILVREVPRQHSDGVSAPGSSISGRIRTPKSPA